MSGLLAVKDGTVTFQWKDYRHKQKHKSRGDGSRLIPVSSTAFLIHTLEPGFQRIRHYGFLANRYRKREAGSFAEKLLQHPVTECCCRGTRANAWRFSSY